MLLKYSFLKKGLMVKKAHSNTLLDMMMMIMLLDDYVQSFIK